MDHRRNLFNRWWTRPNLCPLDRERQVVTVDTKSSIWNRSLYILCRTNSVSTFRMHARGKWLDKSSV